MNGLLEFYCWIQNCCTFDVWKRWVSSNLDGKWPKYALFFFSGLGFAGCSQLTSVFHDRIFPHSIQSCQKVSVTRIQDWIQDWIWLHAQLGEGMDGRTDGRQTSTIEGRFTIFEKGGIVIWLDINRWFSTILHIPSFEKADRHIRSHRHWTQICSNWHYKAAVTYKKQALSTLETQQFTAIDSWNEPYFCYIL